MIIEKDGIFAKTLKELLKANKTGGVSTILNNLVFKKNEGIILNLENDDIFIKDSNVDFDGFISNDFIAVALVSELEKGDLIVKSSEQNISFNDYCFSNNNGHVVNFNQEETIINDKTFITLNKEQFQKLEKDFELTIGNYFKLSKATDVICFAFNEGKLYKLLPGCNVYEISKFDGVIDDVQLEKNFGHDSYIFIIPHKIFDIIKNEKSISVSYTEKYMYFKGKNIIIRHSTANSNSQLKTKLFKDRLSFISNNKKIATLKDFIFLKEKIKNISSNLYEECETPNINIKSRNDGIIELFIDDTKLTFKTDVTNDISFNVNLLAFNYVLQNLPEDTSILKEDYYLIFKTNDKILFLINKEI